MVLTKESSLEILTDVIKRPTLYNITIHVEHKYKKILEHNDTYGLYRKDNTNSSGSFAKEFQHSQKATHHVNANFTMLVMSTIGCDIKPFYSLS